MIASMIGPWQMFILLALLLAAVAGIVIAIVAVSRPGPGETFNTTGKKTRQGKIAVAFTLILLGTLVQNFPETGLFIRVAAFLAGIFVIIGQLKLIVNLDGSGLWGGILLFVSGAISIVASCIDLAIAGDFRNLFLSGFMYDLNQMFGFVNPDFHTPPQIPDFPLEVIGHGLAIIGLGCLLFYKPFANMKVGLILLLIVQGIQVIAQPVDERMITILGILTIIGYYSLASNVIPPGKGNQAVNALLLMAVGILWTLLIMTDTGYLTIGISAIGTIVWLVGVAKAGQGSDRRGTGAFIAFGVLSFVYLLIRLIPAVGAIGVIFLIPGYIVLAIAFFRFHSNRAFMGQTINGMVLMGIIMLMCLIALIPLVGIGLYCIILLPLIVIAWTNAVSACTKGLAANGLLVDGDVKQAVQNVKSISQNDTVVAEPSIAEEAPEELENRYAPKPVVPETKVHITPPPASTPQEQSTTPQPVTPVPTVKKSQPLILWVGIAVLLFAAGAAIYYFFIGPSINSTTGDSSNNVRMYTYSGLNTNLRSSDDPNSASLAKLSYGVPLLVEKQTQGWAQVKYNNTMGYVSLDYLLSEDDYLLLNSIFGDANTQACLDESRYRRALLDYFKTNRLYGDPAGRPDQSPYSEFQAGWQVYTLQKGSKPNTVLFVGNKEYQDMAVIIRNKNTGQRKCLLFAFDQATKQPTLIYEEDAPLTGYIQEVTSQPYGTKKYTITY